MTPAPAVPEAGDWVVAVWRTGEAAIFAAGNYLELVPLDCRLPSAHELNSSVRLTPTMAGGGLFDLDGRLLAVILPCGERLAAVTATSVAQLLAHDATIAEKVHARYGLLLSLPLPEEARYFAGAVGVVVREVWQRQLGDLAGFVAGDLVVAVNGTAVSTVEDLAPMLTSAVLRWARR